MGKGFRIHYNLEEYQYLDLFTGDEGTKICFTLVIINTFRAGVFNWYIQNYKR